VGGNAQGECSFDAAVDTIALLPAPSSDAPFVRINVKQARAHAELGSDEAIVAEVTAPRIHARGFAATSNLRTRQDVAFGDLLVMPKASPLTSLSARAGKVVIPAPTVGGLRSLAPAPGAQIPCEALMLGGTSPGEEQPRGIGTIPIGHKPRELFATPGGAVVATAYDEGDVTVLSRKGAFFEITWFDGETRVHAWVKQAGLQLKTRAQEQRHLDTAMISVLSSGNGAKFGVLSRGNAGSPETAPRHVRCDGEITVLAGQPEEKARVAMVRVDSPHLAVVGEPMDGLVRVRVIEPVGLSAAEGVALFARAEDVETCSAK
jgi:hypothetical protein